MLANFLLLYVNTLILSSNVKLGLGTIRCIPRFIFSYSIQCGGVRRQCALHGDSNRAASARDARRTHERAAAGAPGGRVLVAQRGGSRVAAVTRFRARRRDGQQWSVTRCANCEPILFI